MTFDAYEVPSWALAILFWRKVLAVERSGIPGSRDGHRPARVINDAAGRAAGGVVRSFF